MLASVIAAAVAFLIIVVALGLLRTVLEKRSDAAATLSAVGTLLALAIGGSWYFVERPTAAKLKIEHATSVYAVAAEPGSTAQSPQALVIAEVVLTNLGRTALSLEDQRYRVLLQRITPLPTDVAKSLAQERLPNGLPVMQTGDVWDGGLIAQLSSETLDTVIEAGETENLYFRALAPCRSERVYLTTQFEKPKPKPWFSRRSVSQHGEVCSEGNLCWVKQSIVDLTQACKVKK